MTAHGEIADRGLLDAKRDGVILILMRLCLHLGDNQKIANRYQLGNRERRIKIQIERLFAAEVNSAEHPASNSPLRRTAARWKKEGTMLSHM